MPRPGPGLAQGADRADPAQRVALAVAVGHRRELDDRDVEVADRGDQVERVAPVLGLLDLLAVTEQAADSQPHSGLLVDYQAASFVGQSLPFHRG